MRRVTRIAALAAGVVVGQLAISVAHATDYTWSNLSGGTTAWNLASNWSGLGFPIAAGDRGDMNVGITGNLDVSLASDTTLAALLLGSTSNPVSVNIGSTSGGALIFDNGPSGTSIFSRGVAGVTNVISAPIQISGGTTAGTTLAIGSATEADDPRANQRSLTLNGTIQPIGFDRTLSNNLRNGAVLTINGDVILSGGPDTVNVGTNGRRLNIAGVTAGATVINGRFLTGTLPPASITGGSGTISLGTTQGPSASLPLIETVPHQYTMNADNTAFTGAIVLNRGRYILNGANALGSGEIRGGNPANYGFELIAGLDNYEVNADFRTVQNITFRGSNSFIFNKTMWGTQNRAVVNLLPEGESLTLTKAWYTAANTGDSRTSFFDGSGTTYLEGGIRNYYAGSTAIDDNAGNGGSIVQRGTGKLIVNGTGSTMRGMAMVSGGLLEFATPGSYGVQADNGAGSPNAGAIGMYTNPGGAVGVRTGSLNADFLNLFTRDYPLTFQNFNDALGNQVNSRGAIALSTVDASTNIDYGAGDFTNPRLNGVSIGALSSGVTYTGTITPADNTYRLGGGGTLTMANANQLTGARNLEVVNGGTVVLAQANNFTGTTTVQGLWIATGIESATASTGNLLQTYTITNPDTTTTTITERPISGVRIDPVLEVKKLDDTNGSSLAGTSAIRLRGGTLKYSGTTNDSTSKVLTIGSVGGTLDSSGTGTINFANTSAAILEDQADITSLNGVAATTLSTANGGSINFGQNDPLMLANVGLGWTVAGPGIPTTATINAIAYTAPTNPSNQTTVVLYLKNDGTTSFTGQLGAQTYAFTNQHRTLNLTGSNTGNNTIANALGDSAKGKLGLNKTGAGKWILSGNNSYTGATTVSAGTLGLGSVNALGATSGTTVKTGATLAIATPASSAIKIDNAKLTRESGSTIDMLHGKLVLDYDAATSFSTIKADVLSGYAAGAFNGTGITTSDTQSGKKLRVGYAEASLILGASGGTWFGQTVDGSAILLAGTFAGDSNLDGAVDFDDLLKLAQNYNGTGKEWTDGDSDYNGSVNFDDLLALAQSYNSALAVLPTDSFSAEFQSDFALAMSLVPEPTSLGGLIALGLLGRRRRD